MAKRKRKARSASARKRRRRRNPPPFAANPRRRRTRRRRARASSRRRRTYRRNPPTLGTALSPRGIVNRVVQGATDALVVTGGKAAANIVCGYIPAFLTEPGPATVDGKPTQIETQTGKVVRKLLGAAAVAVVASMAVRSRDVQRFAVAGALTSLTEELVRPVVAKLPAPFSGALSSGGRMYLPAMRAYPGTRRLAGGMVSAYPRLSSYGGGVRNRPPLGQAGVSPGWSQGRP